jgi:hypothetical protein
MRGRLIPDNLDSGQVDTWEATHLAESNLVDQNAVRVEQGWSDALQRKATQFHDDCEGVARLGNWADRSYIFYSINKNPTTLGIEAQLESAEEFPNLESFLHAVGWTAEKARKRNVIPPPRKEGTLAKRDLAEPLEQGVFHVENWSKRGAIYRREKWRFATVQQIFGDGTVPLSSLIGFGGPVNVFRKVIGEKDNGDERHPDEDIRGLAHSKAPNHPWCWRRVVEVIEGHDVSDHLDSAVDPVDGVDPDPKLTDLWKEAWVRAQK